MRLIAFLNDILYLFFQQDSLSLTEDSGISESCDDTEEAILTKMKLLAQDLEQKLSLDSNLVQEIAQVKNITFLINLKKTCYVNSSFFSDFENKHLRFGRTIALQNQHQTVS